MTNCEVNNKQYVLSLMNVYTITANRNILSRHSHTRTHTHLGRSMWMNCMTMRQIRQTLSELQRGLNKKKNPIRSRACFARMLSACVHCSACTCVGESTRKKMIG